MSYELHNFNAGDTLYASDLNEMDNQILQNETDIASVSAELSDYKTSNDTEVSTLKSELTQYFPLNCSKPLSGAGVYMNGGYGRVYANSSGTSGLRSANTQNDVQNYRELRVYASTAEADLKNAAEVMDMVGGSAKYYKIYGEHNKPSGSYVGNGSETERVINTGGLASNAKMLYIYCGASGTSALVTGAGILCWKDAGGGTVECLPLSHGEFSTDGTCKIRSTSHYLNENTRKYYWRVF